MNPQVFFQYLHVFNVMHGVNRNNYWVFYPNGQNYFLAIITLNIMFFIQIVQHLWEYENLWKNILNAG